MKTPRNLTSFIFKILLATTLLVGSGIGIYFIVDTFVNEDQAPVPDPKPPDPEVPVAPEVTMRNFQITNESSMNNQKGSIELDINVNNQTPEATTYQLGDLTLTKEDDPTPIEQSANEGTNIIGGLTAGTYDLELSYSYTINQVVQEVDKITKEDIIIKDYSNIEPDFTFKTIQTSNALGDTPTGGIEITYDYEDVSNALIGTEIDLDISGPTNYTHSFSPVIGTDNVISIPNKFLPGEYILEATYQWLPGTGLNNEQGAVKYNGIVTVLEDSVPLPITIIPNEFTDDNFYDNLIFDFNSNTVPMLGVHDKTNGIHIYNQYIDFYFDYNDKGPTGEGMKIYPPNTPYPSTDQYLNFDNSIDQQIFINDFTNFMIYFQENVYTTHQIMKLESMTFTNRNDSHMWGNNEIFFLWDSLYGGMGAPMYEEDNKGQIHTTIGENPEIAHQIIAHEYGHHETVSTMSTAGKLTNEWKKLYDFDKFEEYWRVSKWDQIPKMAEYFDFAKDEMKWYLKSYAFSSTPNTVAINDYDNYEGFPTVDIKSYDGSKVRTFKHGQSTGAQDFSYLMSYHERLARDLTVLQVDIDFDNYPTWDMIVEHWDIQMIKEFFPGGWIWDDQQALNEYYDTILKHAYADTNLGTFGNESFYVETDGSYDIKERTINGTTNTNNEYSYLVFENDEEIIKSEIKYYQPIYYLDANRDREELGYKWTATLPIDEIEYDGDTYDVYFEDASGNKIETFTYSSNAENVLKVEIERSRWIENRQIVFENNNGNIEATFKM